MGKKLLLNTLYTIGIFVSGFIGYMYGIVPQQYIYVAAAAVFIVIFIVLKVRILKEVRSTQKP